MVKRESSSRDRRNYLSLDTATTIASEYADLHGHRKVRVSHKPYAGLTISTFSTCLAETGTSVKMKMDHSFWLILLQAKSLRWMSGFSRIKINNV